MIVEKERAEAPLRGRPRGFDPVRAVDDLAAAFTAHGYHATTVTQLTAATGLHRGSLYAAFGDKHAMFLAVLRASATRTLADLDADLATAESPLAGVRTYLRRQARRAANQNAAGHGCLLANTTLELLPGDSEVGAVIAEHQRLVIEHLVSGLDAARTRGELTTRRCSLNLARHLFTVVEGLWQLARTTPDETVLTDLVEAALDTLY